MALQKTITLTDSFGEPRTFKDAYIKINFVHASKTEALVEADVYKEKGGMRIYRFASPFEYKVDGEALTQGYEHIKTLPEYSGAEDV